jgi:group II intron reverse transcriptase/maturase
MRTMLGNRETLCPELDRVARLAKERPRMRFTSLAHLMDEKFLKGAWQRVRKDGAVGVDQQSAKEYAVNLDANLRGLCERLRSGRYKAPPVRRVWIPKDGGKQRPLGIPTIEDKLVQRAVAMILEAVHEQDFLDCSHGFRPKRSAHGALQQLQDVIVMRRVGWVLDADIEDFFGTLDHQWLRKMVRHRVNDGSIDRLIGKWLHAGVLEEGAISHPSSGTPQGGVISPVLANIYLHYVLDLWFEKKIKRSLRGEAHLFRYADDVVLCFEHEEDAREVATLLRERLLRFGLRLNETKTKLIRFGRRAKGPDGGKPESFNFLGFTHVCGKTRKGKFTVKRRTMKSRLHRAMRRVTEWCRTNRHLPVAEQQARLNRGLRGHYNYYGITGNSHGLQQFYDHVVSTWRKWLDRRGRRGSMPWYRLYDLLERLPLRRPFIAHSVYASR